MKFSVVAGLSLAALALSADIAHAQRLRGAIRRGAGIAQVLGGVRGRIVERFERVQGPTEADRQRELQSYQEGYQTALQQREAEQRLAEQRLAEQQLAARMALRPPTESDVRAAGWESEAFTLVVPGESSEIANYRRSAYDPAPYLGPVPTDRFDDAPDVADDTVARYPYRADLPAPQRQEEFFEPLYAPLRRPSSGAAGGDEIYDFESSPGSDDVAHFRSQLADPSTSERYDRPSYPSAPRSQGYAGPQRQTYVEPLPPESPLSPRGGIDLLEGSDSVCSTDDPSDGGRPTSMSF